MTIDPTFLECVKAEIAAGETVALVVGTKRDERRWRRQFTALELKSVRFIVGADGAANSSNEEG